MLIPLLLILALSFNGCAGISANQATSQNSSQTQPQTSSTTNVSLLLSLLKAYKSNATATATATSTNTLPETSSRLNSTGSPSPISTSGSGLPSPEAIQRLREKEDRLMHSGRLPTPFEIAMRQGRLRSNTEAPVNKMMEMVLLLTRVEMAQSMGCKTLGDVLELEGMENIPLQCARRCPMGTSCKMVGPIGLCCPKRAPVRRFGGFPGFGMNFGAWRL